MNNHRHYSEKSFPAIFRNRVEKNHQGCFLRSCRSGQWIDFSWDDVKRTTDAAASYLINSGLQAGDKVAIYSENRPEWIFADLAVLSAAGCDVTIFATNSAAEAAFIVNDSDSRFCFCGGKLQVENLLPVKDKMPKLEKIIVFDDIKNEDPIVVRFRDIIADGRDNLREIDIDRRIRGIDPEEVMTLMYTSGTTGAPKGVMLSHSNIVAQVINFVRHQPHPDRETALSILPLAHALERSIIYYHLLYIEGIICFSRGPEYILKELQQIQPTALLCVPRIPEKLFEGIMDRVDKSGFAKRTLFRWAEKVGRKAVPHLAAGRPLPPLKKIRYAVADTLVFSRLRKSLGLNRLTCAGVGGAALPTRIHEFFIAMKVDWLTGYGLTETSPVTHTHTHKWISPIKIGTAGLPLPMTECRIAADGEILIRGPQVMMGYYKRPDETDAVFTDDGWFRTGDIGNIDRDGYLTITDRKKDVIITSGGKNVAPLPIEMLVGEDPYIDQIMLVGNNRKFISALIVPAFDRLKAFAEDINIQWTTHKDLIRNPKVIALFRTHIQDRTRTLAQYKKIRRFLLLPTAFTHENGHATPTMKIKRRIIETAFKDQIDGIYRRLTE